MNIMAVKVLGFTANCVVTTLVLGLAMQWMFVDITSFITTWMAIGAIVIMLVGWTLYAGRPAFRDEAKLLVIFLVVISLPIFTALLVGQLTDERVVKGLTRAA